jgi:hypothetical protein
MNDPYEVNPSDYELNSSLDMLNLHKNTLQKISDDLYKKLTGRRFLTTEELSRMLENSLNLLEQAVSNKEKCQPIYTEYVGDELGEQRFYTHCFHFDRLILKIAELVATIRLRKNWGYTNDSGISVPVYVPGTSKRQRTMQRKKASRRRNKIEYINSKKRKS